MQQTFGFYIVRMFPKLLIVVLLVCGASVMAGFPVQQGRFDTTAGYQTDQVKRNNLGFTNLYAVRPVSTNFIYVEDHASSFGTLAAYSVTNDWYGGFNDWEAWTNVTRNVLQLRPGSGSFNLQITNVFPGLYGVQLFGVVTNEVALSGYRPALLWRVVIDDGLTIVTNHLIQNYISGKCYDVCQFWVQSVRFIGPSNNISVTLSLPNESEVGCNLVAIHFFAPRDWSDQTTGKTTATLYTAAEHSGYTNFATTNTEAGYVLDWKNGSPTLPTITGNKTNIFNRWPPLNVMWDESQGTTITNATDWKLAPHHSTDQSYKSDYAVSFGFTNPVTHESRTLADIISGVVTPGTSNDFVGFFYTNGVWAATYGTLMHSLHQNYIMPMVVLKSSEEAYHLPSRYYAFPQQTNAAHAAGLILAKFALTYPSYRLETIDINPNIKNPSAYLDYNLPRWWMNLHTGKIAYTSAAGVFEFPYIVSAVDQIWPYISTSQSFADDLTLFVPWIGGSTNNVKLFFETHLLKTLAFDLGYRSVAHDPMSLGVSLQSGTLSSNLMNPAESIITLVPSSADASWKKQYAGSYVRDGVNLIGSSFYLVGENFLLTGPDLTRRYIANGGQIGNIIITNTALFPKLGAFVDYYCNAQVGYNYSCSFGDAGMSINEGPGVEGASDAAYLWKLWNISNNPRLAKYIVDVTGRTIQTESEWNAVTASAATTSVDLRIPVASRIFSSVGVGILEQGIGTTNQLQRGALVMRTVSGYGHDHGDHLDLNIYSLGSRMGTDFAERNESSLVVYPNATSTRVHNVVEVDGYNHVTATENGWPGGNTEGGYSGYTAFSTNGSAQMLGADLWNGGYHTNINWQHRDSVIVKVDETNSYVVDFQRVHGGRFHSWSFHGADVGGESAGFTTSLSLTNVTDFTDFDGTSPGFFMRKHATNAAYPVMAAAMNTNKVYAEWRLGRTATSAGSILNYDGNGGTVTAIAPEQAMFGSAYSGGSARKYIRATLFDRTNDLIGTAWAFSPNYRILQGRMYVFTPGTTYFTNLTERSGTWAALYDPYLGTRVVTSESSLTTDTTLTNAFMPKVLEVITPAGIDRHYSSGTNLDCVAGGDAFNGTYAFTRMSNSVVSEWKLVGGTKLVKGLTLTTATNNIAIGIASVNYTNRTLVLTHPIPVRKAGWYRIRNSTHETSYYISAWSTPTNAAFVGDALIGELDVTTVSANTINFSSAAGGYVLAGYPKRGTGITAQNEARSKTLKVTYGDAAVLATRTSGDSVVTGDFADTDGDGHVSLWLYDFGAGDTLEVPADVWIQSLTNGYLVSANIGFYFTPIGTVSAGQLTGEPQLLGNSGHLSNVSFQTLITQ